MPSNAQVEGICYVARFQIKIVEPHLWSTGREGAKIVEALKVGMKRDVFLINIKLNGLVAEHVCVLDTNGIVALPRIHRGDKPSVNALSERRAHQEQDNKCGEGDCALHTRLGENGGLAYILLPSNLTIDVPRVWKKLPHETEWI